MPAPVPLPNSSTVFFSYGKAEEGYWNNELFLAQMKVAIKMHEHLFPGTQAVFQLDHSSGHRKYGSDALIASKMSKSSGGSQPFMKNGVCRVGLAELAVSRGLLTTEAARQTRRDELEKLIAAQPDFIAEKTLVDLLVEAAGHRVVWNPKFHCEMNPIEMFWAATKLYTRNNCKYSFPELKQVVPFSLTTVSVSLIRSFFRKSRDYMRGYSLNTATHEIDAFVKAYRSHRRVFDSSLRSISISTRSAPEGIPESSSQSSSA